MDEQTAAKWRTCLFKQRYQELEPMEKTLLADRCQFRAHEVTRELPIYELVISKAASR